MRNIVIPEIFFKRIAEQDKLYSRIWFYWLSNFVDEIHNSDFIEKQILAFPKVSEIKEVYEFGIQLLRQDFEIIEKIDENKLKVVESIIDYLNKKAGTTFQAKGKNKELIYARIKDGYTTSDFKIVIDKKTEQWIGTKDEVYLRPITLFCKTKFENYLNGITKSDPTSFSKFASTIADAKMLVGLYEQPR
jgi:uncharacterized phage protein (TIGR02220 family)